MKMRIFSSACMLALLYVTAPHAWADCDNSRGGSFLDRLANKEDCFDQNLDSKIDKFKNGQKRFEDFGNRLKSIPQRETQKFHDRLDRIFGPTSDSAEESERRDDGHYRDDRDYRQNRNDRDYRDNDNDTYRQHERSYRDNDDDRDSDRDRDERDYRDR